MAVRHDQGKRANEGDVLILSRQDAQSMESRFARIVQLTNKIPNVPFSLSTVGFKQAAGGRHGGKGQPLLRKEIAMIRRLYIDNFKCLVNFELNLQDLTLLVGPNGVGKTSVLDVVFALRQLLAGTAKVTDLGAFPTSTLTRWQKRNMQVFELDAVLEGIDYRYRLEVEHDPTNRRARVVLERLEMKGAPLFRFRQGEVQLYRDNHSAGPIFGADWSESAMARVPPRNDNTHLSRFLDFIRKVIVCGLYPASFASESSTEDAVLHRDARNFAAWYRHLLLERQDLVPEFTKALQEVIAGFRGIRMEKVGLDTRAVMVMFDQQGQRYELRLDEISDGQRALIALYSLVRLAAGPGYTLSSGRAGQLHRAGGDSAMADRVGRCMWGQCGPSGALLAPPRVDRLPRR